MHKDKKNNSLKGLGTLGQSIWLDYIRRDLVFSGGLQKLIEEDGLRGITSNPSIFEKAIVESEEYDDDIRAMAVKGKCSEEIYEALSQRDVARAADEFLALYQGTNGQAGFVSLEVNPHLAHDTNGTITEARRLWSGLNRSNLLIKVPATDEGLPAIKQLIGEGINVNVTLIFGLPRYRQVVEAYLAGLEVLASSGKPMNNRTSVASFFVSRIDAMVDPMLSKIVAQGGQRADIAKGLLGQVAIATAKTAYEVYKDTFSSDRFMRLAKLEARPQQLLWASTGTKNPEYSDVKYIEALIGPDTINTIPPETLDAYRDHGQPNARLEENAQGAHRVRDQLFELGISFDGVVRQLEIEGIEKFNKPYDKLMIALSQKSKQHLPGQTQV